MKTAIYALLLFALLVSCEKDNLSVDSAEITPRSNTVPICHIDPDGSFRVLQVNENALQAHLNHGDFLPDADGDGYTAIDACTGSMDDCDDSDSSIHPGAVEICYDGLDNNCDGSYSDGCAVCPCYSYEQMYELYADHKEDIYFQAFFNAIETIEGEILNGGSIIMFQFPSKFFQYINSASVLASPVFYECLVIDIVSGGDYGYSIDHTEEEFLACNEINFRFAEYLGCGTEKGLNVCGE